MMVADNPGGVKRRGQRNTARFNFRAPEGIKEVVERAAALSGQDMSAFAIDAMYQRALATIRAHEVTLLKAEDHQAFFEALENPPEPTERLRGAFARHKAQVVRN